MPKLIHKGIAVYMAIIGCLATVLFAHSAFAEDKVKAVTIDDLPRHTYEIAIKPSELLTSDDEFAKLSTQIKTDVLQILDTYEIEDKTALQKYYNTLQILYFLDGDYDTSATYLEKARALEEKQAQKFAMGLVGMSYVDALKEESDPMSDAFKAIMRKRMKKRIGVMPWDVVQDILEQLNGQMQILNENVLIGVAESQLDPAVETTGQLSSEQAVQVVMFRSALHHILPYKDDITAVLSAEIAEHAVEKKDIWPERNITLPQGKNFSSVVVAIWDAGVDTDVFEGHLFTNTNEKLDGMDTDGNGFIDDIHGIAYDLQADKTPALLYPLGEHARELEVLEGRIKGFTDITASQETPEADEIRETMASLGPDDVQAFIEGLTLYTNYSHGTHVAGIVTDGNPYAQVLVARLSFDHRVTPRPYTKALMGKYAASFIETTDYFKTSNVRVVNMSWVIGLREIEHNLEANGIGDNAEERGRIAGEMFEICKDALYQAIENAPEVLFVGGAGNSDNDVEFDLFVPPAFELPNLVIAGAVDQAGEPTGFTSFGRTVEVYSNGFEVESFVPGGRRMKFSGTSMAAPNVANLAAKLFARDPSLTPTEVVALIKKGADNIGTEDRPMHVINPQESLALLEGQMAKK